MKKTILASLIAISNLSYVQAAELNITGYASITGGQVLSGTGAPQYDVPPMFLADYPIVSGYTEDWSFKQESLFGLQFQADLGQGLSATMQMVSRGADDFKTEVEWAYLSYEFNDNWTFQAGKKRLPLFYYSDFYDVGYAYTWIRPPADTYTWQIFNYNGVNALYTDNWGDWSVSGNIYTGREESPDNKLLSDFFYRTPVTEIWKDIVGGVFSVQKDWLEVRLTHMQYTNERYIDGERYSWGDKDTRKGKFYGLATNLDFDQFFVLTELNRLDLDGDNFDSNMITLGYRVDSFTPYVGRSSFETQDAEDGEKHNTTFAGVRWDFHSHAAFKLQYDSVKDESFEQAVAGDSKALTVSVDLVF